MTTPQIPANSIEVSDVRDEINPGDGSGIQQSLGSNGVVRRLTGTFSKNASQTSEILLGADLSNKTAFSEITTPSNSNTQTSIVPVLSSMVFTANTDMFEPNIDWQYVINPDSVGVTSSDITLNKNVVIDPNTNRPSSKSATVTLRSARGNKFANLTITGVMSFDGHVVNTCTKTINLTVNAVNTAFDVVATPSFTVDASGVLAQTAVITVRGISNAQVGGASFKFTPSFVSGTGALAPTTTANTITFTATSPQPGVNSAIYNVLTEFFVNGVLLESKTSQVNIRSEFISRKITSLTSTATTNNQFSNSSSQYSTIDITAVHDSIAPTFPQGNITFTYEVNGAAITSEQIASNTSSKTERISLYYDVNSDGFGFKKTIVNVIATLRTPDGIVMDQKRVANLTLRAGTYGLTIKAPTSVTESGYTAQTAISSGGATWGTSQASFEWTPRQFNGSGPDLKITESDKNASFIITATTPTGKNRSQSIANTCNYDFTGVLSYDGITVRTITINDILIKAESLPYTYSLSQESTSNTQMEIDAGATASILVTANKSVGTVTWSKLDAFGGSIPAIVTASTTANVFVTSSSEGSSNSGSSIVFGELRDPSSRVIETLQTPSLALDATTTKLRIVGESVSITTDERTATATGVFESTALFGTHKLRYPPAKLSGNDLTLTQDSAQKITILATATQSVKSGTYRITGEVTYKGITKIVTKDITVSVSALAPSLTVTKVPYEYSVYIPFGDVSFTSGVTGIGTSTTYVLRRGEDIVVESDYPGTINVDYTIRRVVNRLPNFNGVPTVELTGPFYNQAANTDPAPAGFPSSVNKRRDRVDIVPFIGILLDYDITYELYDSDNVFIKDLRVTSSGITIPQPGSTTSLKFDSVTAKTFSFTNKSNNIYGFPEPHPLQVDYQERANFTASYASETSIPTPRFSFTTVKGNVFANVALASNSINGQANVTVKSIYYDASANFSGSLPAITDSTTNVDLTVQLTSTDGGTTNKIGNPVTEARNFSLPMPPGRCYRLSTFSTYGAKVRMRHTQDVFGNSNEIIDYGRVPNISTLNGPETKWIGFHTSDLRYPLNGDPIFGSDFNNTRYYSSEAHRNSIVSAFPAEGNRPSKIIPQNYFVVMSFDPNGPQYIAQVTLIGSDNNAYVLEPWAAGTGGTRASNDNFSFNIYKWIPPSGVTVQYAFLSNVGRSLPPPPPSTDPLSFIKANPGNARLGEEISVNIGTVSGGIVFEDFSGGSGGDIVGIPPGGGGGGGTFFDDFGNVQQK